MHALPIGFESGLMVSNHSCLCVIYCCTMGKVEILILFFFFPLFLCVLFSALCYYCTIVLLKVTITWLTFYGIVLGSFTISHRYWLLNLLRIRFYVKTFFFFLSYCCRPWIYDFSYFWIIWNCERLKIKTLFCREILEGSCGAPILQM